MSNILTADDLLMAHAAGSLPAPVSLVVGTHLALSPEGRARYARYEALGGVLLEGIAPAPVADGALARLLDRLADDDVEPLAIHHAEADGDLTLPRPLRDVLPGRLDELRWRNLGSACEVELDVDGSGAYRTALVKVRAGRAVPKHTHDGNELTVVIEGAYRDALGHYRRGDLAIADGSVDHQPVADEGADCLCLTLTDARLRLTGRFTRFLNPFLRG